MKSGVGGMVAAALQLAGVPLRKAGLTLVLVAGEETGCEGAAYLARTEGALGSAGAMVVGEPTGNVPVIGQKGGFWLQARRRGVTAHGSMPDKGVNAVVIAARAVLSLAGFRFDVAPDPLLGGPTLNGGPIRGGLTVNSVPDEAVIGIDIRTIPPQSHAELRQRLEQLLGKGVELTPIVDMPGIRTAEYDPFVRSVMEAVARVTRDTAAPRFPPYFTHPTRLTPALRGTPPRRLGP